MQARPAVLRPTPPIPAPAAAAQRVGRCAIAVALTLAACANPAPDRAGAPPGSAWRSPPGPDLGEELTVVSPPREPLCPLAGPPATGPGEALVFGDEFDGAALDLARWTTRDGFRRSGVLNHAARDHVTVGDGSLQVWTSRAAAPADPDYPYKAGFLDTLGTFARTYGRIELRARFPREPGVWYSLWGRPWDEPFPEIDIEIINRTSLPRGQLYLVHHWAAPPLPADDRRSYALLEDQDYSAFHTYAVRWTPGRIEWLVDGQSRKVDSGAMVPSKPMYWMINAWVGGWTGAPTDETILPSAFEVDWVRYYREDGLLAEPAVLLLPPVRDSYWRGQHLDVAVANFDEACVHVELREGGALVHATSRAPYRLPLADLAPGRHALTIVATDGVRSASTPLDADVR